MKQINFPGKGRLKRRLEKTKDILYKLISKIKLIRVWIQHYDFKQACNMADEMRARTHKKHCVMKYEGRFVVVERQHLKKLVYTGTFKRGLNLRQIEAAVLYETY